MTAEEKKDHIAQTFMEMAKTMPIKDIRVGELITKAGVSRATFYRLFHDKYDVMNWTYQKVEQPAINERPALADVESWAYPGFAYIKENKKAFRNIVAYQGQNSFYQFMADYFATNIRNAVQKKLGQTELTEELDFAIEMTAHRGAFAMIKWIRGNCEIDEDVLLGYVRGCIPDCLRPFYER